MINVLTVSLGGLAAASKQAETSASRIAGSGPAKPDMIIEDIVDLKSAKMSFKANAAALRTAQAMMEETGRLLDKEV